MNKMPVNVSYCSVKLSSIVGELEKDQQLVGEKDDTVCITWKLYTKKDRDH